jgi:succinate dehydrogenase/fumarate reductase flavoprotein subunit
MALEKVIDTGILVIGGGMAGCFAAIKAKERGVDVTIVDKGYVGKSGATHFCEGGFVIFNPEWGHKFEEWMAQINKSSEYINNQEWTEILLKDSYDRYKDLSSWGVEFDLKPDKIDSPAPGGFKAIQIYNMPHRTFAPLLRKKALESGVHVLDRIVISELIKKNGKVAGAIGFHTTSGDLYIFKARATVLAAGASSIKETNRSTHYWTSDGDAMAYRAGAEIVGKEFKFGGGGRFRAGLKQLDKTPRDSAIPENDINILVRSPSVGPYTLKPTVPVINAEGQPSSQFSGWWEAHNGRTPLYVDLDYLTTAELKDIQVYFDMVGTVYIDKVGLDYSKRGKVRLPGIVPAVQTIHGGAGIWPINTKCATGLPGLYAAGNNCGTMISGASYASAGSGTCGAAVTGTRAGLGAAEYALKAKNIIIDEAELKKLKQIVCAPMERKGGFSPRWTTQVLQGFLVPYFVIQIKHEQRLQAALTFIEFLNNHVVPQLKAEDAHEWRLAQETKNMVLNAEMMLRSSLFRTESRGGHYREDYPRRDDPAWLAWVKIKNEQGEMKVFKEPVPEKWWPDLSKPYEERYPMMFPGE